MGHSLLFKVIAGVSALLLLAAAAFYFTLLASLPVVSGNLELPGLEQPVEIRFDAEQRAYVEASGLDDALAAQGWLHGSRRLWQMELLRRAGKGRLAELLGEDLLASDKELWRYGVPQLAQRLEENASVNMLAHVDAYLAGVNAALDDYRLWPPEFLLLRSGVEPWTRADVFALGALMAFDSANNAGKELLRFGLLQHLGRDKFELFTDDNSTRPDYPFVLEQAISAATTGPADPLLDTAGKGPGILAAFDRLASIDPDQNPLMPRLGFGSNGWVLAPGRSTTGNALFAFDSHDTLGLPNLFYEVHLFIGKGRQIRGWSVPGLPGVINGFNESIAWGFTNIGDSQDLFIETRHRNDPQRFRDGEQWYDARLESVEIPVRDQATVKLDILHTRNGPLISLDPPISLRWTVHELGERGLDALLEFNRARNWTEFNAALDRFPAPTLNATYADIHGDIGFRTAGLLPLRGRGEGLLPQPGDRPENRWQGLVPAKDMPRRSNPPSGYLAAANARVSPPGSYPLVSADNAALYRIARLHQVLGRPGKFSPEDMQALQMDWHDGQAELLLHGMLQNLADQPLGQSATRARDSLSTWAEEPVAARDSAAALIFQQWYLEIAGAVFAEALGPDWYPRLLKNNYLLANALDTLLLTDRHAAWWGPNGTADRPASLAAGLEAAVIKLSAELGIDMASWRLDQRQRVGLHHELSKAVPELSFLFAFPAQPWGGSPAAVGRANYAYDRPFYVSHAATVRAVADMAEVPLMRAVIPGGQSGHPLSDNYTDQFHAWLAGRLFSTSPPEATTDRILLRPRP